MTLWLSSPLYHSIMESWSQQLAPAFPSANLWRVPEDVRSVETWVEISLWGLSPCFESMVIIYQYPCNCLFENSPLLGYESLSNYRIKAERFGLRSSFHAFLKNVKPLLVNTKIKKYDFLIEVVLELCLSFTPYWVCKLEWVLYV